MSKVTEEDLNMVDYFLTEKGDVESWCNWEKRKEIIFLEYPELKHALELEKTAEKVMQCVLDKIKKDAYDLEIKSTCS